jgi:hypothetical protein
MLREHLNYFIIVYLNNILVFLDTLEEYKKYIYKVLNILQEAKLLVKPEKSYFYA